MENREIRPMDDRPYSEKDFEDMFRRLDKLSEEEKAAQSCNDNS